MDLILVEAARLGAMREFRGMVRSAGLRRPSLPAPVFAWLADLMIASGLALKARYGAAVR